MKTDESSHICRSLITTDLVGWGVSQSVGYPEKCLIPAEKNVLEPVRAGYDYRPNPNTKLRQSS